MESGGHMKREEIDTDETESDGFGYTVKLGENFFYYNIKTGEHQWPTNSPYSEKTITRLRTSDVPPKANELSSVATQTEDNGCVNQCTLMYDDNERQTENTNMMNKIKVEARDDDTIEYVNGQNTLNNTDADDNLDGACEDFEIDESLSTIITEIESKKDLVQNVHPQHQNFKKRRQVISNAQTRTREKPLKCSYCFKTFGWKSDLDRHLRTHTGEKPFECSYCDKAFAKKCNLNTHLRTHTGEKPYACPYCDKAFGRKGDFKVHQRSHTGEKPYECSYCEKPFARKHNLKRHIRTHTGEKPFECLYCVKAYSQKRDLSRHLQLHASEKPYE